MKKRENFIIKISIFKSKSFNKFWFKLISDGLKFSPFTYYWLLLLSLLYFRKPYLSSTEVYEVG